MSAPGRSQALIPEPFKGEGTPVSAPGTRASYLGPLPDHGRFRYRPITRRPAWRWPGDAGLAVYIGFNIEHFAFGEGMGAGIGPTSPAPRTTSTGTDPRQVSA